MNLPGKPDPALFLEAVRRLALPASRAAVVEAALPGIEAGRKGGFGQVIAVDRDGRTTNLGDLGAKPGDLGPGLGDHAADLGDLRAGLGDLGADLVVSDLGELIVHGKVLPVASP
jgi:beta-phosphoglucomutase-like phosphatase (HAD superfamily)